jgi:hypothetical protein
MKKIIEFFKSLFTKMEYVPTEYNVSLNEEAVVEVKKPAKKKATKKPATKKAVKKTETKKTTKKK